MNCTISLKFGSALWICGGRVMIEIHEIQGQPQIFIF